MEPGPPPGRLRTTSAGLVAGWALAGLVLGRLLRPLLTELDRTAPQIGWLQAGSLYLLAAILLAVARATHRAVHRSADRPADRPAREPLQPHEAVNRLVLAKACALVGALATGGYLGHALSWVGSSAELGTERIVMSLVAAVGAALTVVGSLLLERACRVSRDGDES